MLAVDPAFLQDGVTGCVELMPLVTGRALASHAPQTPDEVRVFFRDWIGYSNARQWERLGRMMHADVVSEDPMTPEPARGRDEMLSRTQGLYEPFPDGRVDMIGTPFVSLDGSEVAYQWCFVGTHLRSIDPPGFAPTGQRVVVEGTSVLRFRDGQVDHGRLFFDTTDFARQVLAAPPAGSRLERVIVLSQRVRVRLRRRPSRR